MDGISNNPYQYAVEKLKDGTFSLRAIINKRTILTYEVDDDTQTVTVLNALAARTDWK